MTIMMISVLAFLVLGALLRINIWYWRLPPEERELEEDDPWW